MTIDATGAPYTITMDRGGDYATTFTLDSADALLDIKEEIPFQSRGGSLSAERIVIRAGTLQTNSTVGAGVFSVTGGQIRVLEQGTLTVGGNQNLNLVDGSSLYGSGIVNAHLTNAGFMAPGLSQGQLQVLQDYTQESTGTLEIELGGTMPGSGHDQVAVTGDATLGGALEVKLADGYSPIPIDTFTILTANAVSGTFDSVSVPSFLGGLFTLDLVYHADRVVLDVIARLLPGDANNDLLVSGLDLISVQQNFGKAEAVGPTGLLPGDANDDGIVSGLDLIKVQENFGKALAGSGASVPEPMTVMGLGLLTVGLGVRRSGSFRGR